jgi:hypothetical protein
VAVRHQTHLKIAPLHSRLPFYYGWVIVGVAFMRVLPNSCACGAAKRER